MWKSEAWEVSMLLHNVPSQTAYLPCPHERVSQLANVSLTILSRFGQLFNTNIIVAFDGLHDLDIARCGQAMRFGLADGLQSGTLKAVVVVSCIESLLGDILAG